MEVKMLEIRSERGITRPVLLSDEAHLALVDTSYPLMAEAVLQAVRQAGADPAALDMILITHQDLDHVGCIRDILTQYPGIKVLCHEEEAPYIDGRRTPVKLQALPEGHELRLAYARRVVPIAQVLADGERLPFFGGVVALHTPGHTPGHMCLYVEAARALIAGDALNVVDGALSGPNPVYTQDMALGYRSLEKLLPFDIECVYTFHGGAFRGDVSGALKALTASGPKA
jgi:glyoxylase-like metal-dependent hydrolase (beta-lactamase superfamily II)